MLLGTEVVRPARKVPRTVLTLVRWGLSQYLTDKFTRLSIDRISVWDTDQFDYHMDCGIWIDGGEGWSTGRKSLHVGVRSSLTRTGALFSPCTEQLVF